MPQKHHVVRRPWLNDECHTLRNQYKHAKNRSRRTDTLENYKYLTNASRAYKRGINKQFSKYRRKDFIQKLRSLKTTDPKSYWSLLNKANSSSQSKVLQKVSLDVFAEHFKTLNTTSEINDNTYLESD